jgi:hypothetical protein
MSSSLKDVLATSRSSGFTLPKRCRAVPDSKYDSSLRLAIATAGLGQDAEQDGQLSPEPSQRKRGFLNPKRVVAFSFWTTAASILIAVVASILAIWEFTGTDALWRTVATCVVIGMGTIAFSLTNRLFTADDD